MGLRQWVVFLLAGFAALGDAFAPPDGGIYEAFTELDEYLSMYLTIYPDHFKIQLTYKKPHGFFAIALPVNDQQYRMRNADAFVYGALQGFENSANAELREFWLSNHLLEADRRVHHGKLQVQETKKEDGRTTVIFKRLNEVGEAGISLSNYNNSLPMLWSHAGSDWYDPYYGSADHNPDDVIREHGAGNRGAVIFSVDGAHTVTYATTGIIVHTVLSFIAMGVLVPLGSLWDRFKLGCCRKINLGLSSIILFAGVAIGFVSCDEHFANAHAGLSVGLCGLYILWALVQTFRSGTGDAPFSAVRLVMDVVLLGAMIVMTYFVFTSGVSFLALTPMVNTGLDILLAIFFAVMVVAVCGPLIHYLRIRSKNYGTLDLKDPDTPGGGVEMEETAGK